MYKNYGKSIDCVLLSSRRELCERKYQEPETGQHGGGGRDAQRWGTKLCPTAIVEDGTPIHGAEAANADSEAREIAG